MKEFKTPKGTTLPMSAIQGKDYLLVAHRLVWFREEHNDWGIETAVTVGQDSATARCTVRDASGRIISTATKFEDRKGFPDFIEKAETGSIGRALALCGYGTQFAPEFDEGDRLADTPIKAKTQIQTQKTPLATITGGVTCTLCGAELRSGKYSWYCPNYKDETRGKHPSLTPEQYSEHKAEIESMAEDVPNEFGNLK